MSAPFDNSERASVPPGSTATSFLHQLWANDPQGWERLTTCYTGWLYLLCRQHQLTPDEAEDVAQDVLLAVVRRISSFRRDRPGDTFRGWLRTITERKIIDFQRKQRGRPRAIGGDSACGQLLQQAIDDGDEDDSSASSDPGMLALLIHDSLAVVRNDFKERTWEAFWLTVVEGRSVAEVAEELGKSTFAVYQARSRILRRLREVLGDVPS